MKKAFIVCDNERAHAHDAEPALAAGRIGVQIAGVPVRWRDLCGSCLAKAVKETPFASNGKRAAHPTTEDGIMAKMARLLRKGPISGPELMDATGIESQSVLYRMLKELKARKRGRRSAMWYSLPAD